MHSEFHVAGQLCIITLRGWCTRAGKYWDAEHASSHPYHFKSVDQSSGLLVDVAFIVMTAGLKKFKVLTKRRGHVGPEASNLVIRWLFDPIIWFWLSKRVHALFLDTLRQRGQDTDLTASACRANTSNSQPPELWQLPLMNHTKVSCQHSQTCLLQKQDSPYSKSFSASKWKCSQISLFSSSYTLKCTSVFPQPSG